MAEIEPFPTQELFKYFGQLPEHSQDFFQVYLTNKKVDSFWKFLSTLRLGGGGDGGGDWAYFPVQATVHRYLQPRRDWFLAVVVWNCVSILNFVDWNRVRFFALWNKSLQSPGKQGMLFTRMLHYFGISGSGEQGWS